MASQYTDPAAEVQQLQQELYKMRQKEMQQEHNIHVLTAQLKSRQLIPAQVCTCTTDTLPCSLHLSVLWSDAS